MSESGTMWGPKGRAILPDAVLDWGDRRWARRQVEKPEAPSSWPHLWRTRFIDSVVGQTISAMEQGEDYAPVTAITVFHPEPAPRRRRGWARRFRPHPDAADYSDDGTLLSIRKEVYRLLVEDAEGRGHHPPPYLRMSLVARVDDVPWGVRARVSRWWGLGLEVRAGDPQTPGPDPDDQATVADSGAPRCVANRRLWSAGPVRDVLLDDRQPIRRLTEAQMGVSFNPAPVRLREQVARLEKEQDDIEEEIGEIAHALLPSPGDDAYLVQLHDELGVVASKLALARLHLAGASPGAVEFEICGPDQVRVRGLGHVVRAVGERRRTRVWSAVTSQFGRSVAADDGDTFQVDGRVTWRVGAS